MTIEERVNAILVEQLGVYETDVIPEASLVEDLGADSLDMVEVVMAIEEEFNIEISDEDAEQVATVAAVVAYVRQATAATQES